MTTMGDREALEEMLGGYRNAALLYVAAKLGVADDLAEGPRTATELAMRSGAHGDSLHRVLRGLALLNVVRECGDGRFELGPAGEWLRSDREGSLRGWAILCGEEYMPAWGNLLHSARTGETAFDDAFGMSPWEHRRQAPELGTHFNAWLAGATARAAEAIAGTWDFSRFAMIADVGGGTGALLAAILRAHPTARGVLVDQASVADDACALLHASGVADRCRFEAADFFERVPAGADLYILKSVIHDWDDERSVAILRNCRAACGEDGTLMLVERALPERAVDDPRAVMLDLHMMAVTGGRERTMEEYDDLLRRGGFRIAAVAQTAVGFHLFECAPA